MRDRAMVIYDRETYKKETSKFCCGLTEGTVESVAFLEDGETSPDTLIDFIVEKSPECAVEFLAAHERGDFNALDKWEEWVKYKKERRL